MILSDLLSIIALIVSMLTFFFSVKTHWNKSNVNINDVRNVIRENIFLLTNDILILIDNIRSDNRFANEVNNIESLVNIADSLNSIHYIIKNRKTLPWYINSNSILNEYSQILSELNETKMILSQANVDLSKGDFKNLKMRIDILKNRVIGSMNNN